ncbi:MAG: hypothetical protein KDD94_00120 [Calditrichaeota bacterium]|nr:hypothetical protein [Calditrichota bacterium]
MKINSLPEAWQSALSQHINLELFFTNLTEFLDQFPVVIPFRERIFSVFDYMEPSAVKCVVFGEDPYPRLSSAQGIAFWDAELAEWTTKSRGNCVRNMMKALLIAKGDANYSSSMDHCRQQISDYYDSPGQMFRHWLENGVFLLNSALTFSSSTDKKLHFNFWRPFIEAVIDVLAKQDNQPFFILWGRQAQQWQEKLIINGIDENRIIRQNHPTFIHQFLDKEKPDYSPFTEIIERTQLDWI